MPSGLLHDENVRYYHPTDDLTEYTKDIVWDGVSEEFAPGLLISGIQAATGTIALRLEDVISPNYDDIQNASGFTVAIWTSGFFDDNGLSKEIRIGFANSSHIYRNAIILYKDSPTVEVNVTIEGTTSDKSWTPAPTFDSNWHLIVADARYETSGWRHRVSLDGSGWLDLGVDSQTNVPGVDEWTYILTTKQSSASILLSDEIVCWGDNDLFTAQELSNLYELYNTYSTTMDQYTSTFGTNINGNIDCFIHGHAQISGDISLYIPGQLEVGSISLYIAALTPVSGNMDSYIQGSILTSGNINLYISNTLNSSNDLYIAGPIPISGYIDTSIVGHLPASGSGSLFIQGRLQDVDVFVAVVDNNPSNDLDLFIHGVASGESTTFYINNTTTFFISDNGEDGAIDSSWSAFTRVADAISGSTSGIWQSFVKCGNTVNNNIDLYINGHAPGDSPHGTLISGLFTSFINGQATQDGDEGLLSDGYYVDNLETSAFVKVHLGVIDTVTFYISGAIPVIPPSASLDLFMFGILGTTSGSSTLYIPSLESINDNYDLFIFGIQGLESGSTSLYIEVTSTGLFNQESIFYTHGF